MFINRGDGCADLRITDMGGDWNTRLHGGRESNHERLRNRRENHVNHVSPGRGIQYYVGDIFNLIN